MEIHIEQGALLYNEGIDIGVVNGMVSITRYNITIKENQIMRGLLLYGRNDPIKKMPKIINKLYELAENYENPFVVTIGNISVEPGMYNVIPRSGGNFY